MFLLHVAARFAVSYRRQNRAEYFHLLPTRRPGGRYELPTLAACSADALLDGLTVGTARSIARALKLHKQHPSVEPVYARGLSAPYSRIIMN